MIDIDLGYLQNGAYPVGHATEKNAETLEIAFDNEFFPNCDYYKFQAVRPDGAMIESEELTATEISGAGRKKITLALDAQYLICSGNVRCQVIGCKVENGEITMIKASDMFSLKVLASVAEKAKRITTNEGGMWEQLVHDVAALKAAFGGKTVVTEITNASTNNEIGSAAATYDLVQGSLYVDEDDVIISASEGSGE